MMPLVRCFHRTFDNGGPSASYVLLWQTSDCSDLFVIVFSHYFQKNMLLLTMIEEFSESFRFPFSLQIG